MLTDSPCARLYAQVYMVVACSCSRWLAIGVYIGSRHRRTFPPSVCGGSAAFSRAGVLESRSVDRSPNIDRFADNRKTRYHVHQVSGSRSLAECDSCDQSHGCRHFQNRYRWQLRRRARLAIRESATDLWQITGTSGTTDANRRVKRSRRSAFRFRGDQSLTRNDLSRPVSAVFIPERGHGDHSFSEILFAHPLVRRVSILSGKPEADQQHRRAEYPLENPPTTGIDPPSPTITGSRSNAFASARRAASKIGPSSSALHGRPPWRCFTVTFTPVGAHALDMRIHQLLDLCWILIGNKAAADFRHRLRG